MDLGDQATKKGNREGVGSWRRVKDESGIIIILTKM